MTPRTQAHRVLHLAAAGACCLAHGAVSARADWATLTWQANDGRGWTSGRLETTSSSVQVRLFADWDVPEALGFGNTIFDGTITTAHEAGDTASNFTWPWLLIAGRHPWPSRFGNVLKIDDARDTLPPGEGPLWYIAGQLPPQFGFFVPTRPVAVVTFDLDMDGVPGTRLVDMIHRPGIPLVRLYTDEVGAVATPPTEVFPLEIVYIPAPTSALLLFAGLVAHRRRR